MQLTEALESYGVDIRTGRKATKVEQTGDTVTVHTDDGEHGDRRQAARRARPRRRRRRTSGSRRSASSPARRSRSTPTCACPSHPWLYAIGDVNGRALFTHMGKYQARLAADHVLGHDHVLAHGADGPLSPRVIFTEPQVAAVGHTTESAHEAGLITEIYETSTSGNAGGSFYGRNAPGTTRWIVDSERKIVVGCTITGAEVADFLHAATIAIVGEVPLSGSARDPASRAPRSGCVRSRRGGAARGPSATPRRKRRVRHFGGGPFTSVASLFASQLRVWVNYSRRSDVQAPKCSSAISGKAVHDRRRLRPQAEPVPRPSRGRPGAPSPLRRARLPVVAAGGDRPRRHRPGDRHLLRRPVPRRARLGLHRRPLHRRDQRLGVPAAAPTTRRARTTTAASPSPCCGTRRPSGSSPTSPRTSSRSSTRGPAAQYYPPDKRALIAELNEWIYSEFQNGVYRAGFSRSQEAYDEAFRGVFTALDRLEQTLSEQQVPGRRRDHARRLARAPHAAALRRRLPHALPLQRASG